MPAARTPSFTTSTAITPRHHVICRTAPSDHAARPSPQAAGTGRPRAVPGRTGEWLPGAEGREHYNLGSGDPVRDLAAGKLRGLHLVADLADDLRAGERGDISDAAEQDMSLPMATSRRDRPGRPRRECTTLRSAIICSRCSSETPSCRRAGTAVLCGRVTAERAHRGMNGHRRCRPTMHIRAG
jgi:hypothetical protein